MVVPRVKICPSRTVASFLTNPSGSKRIVVPKSRQSLYFTLADWMRNPASPLSVNEVPKPKRFRLT